MAMNSDMLGTLMAQVMIDASETPPSGAMAAKIREFWRAMAAEIVTHIQNYAVVSTQVVVGQGIPVATSGTQTSQTGATTASGSGVGTGRVS
jgi:hypothetical protein